MRSVRKLLNSKAFALIYSLTNGKKNKKIREILLKEQKKICAYTESYIGREDGGEIDHFNPELKGKPEDGYHNYFVIKSQWNKEKKGFEPWHVRMKGQGPYAPFRNSLFRLFWQIF